ncbi:hypothetical protein [Novipirellula maiorica]|uniref:hypothetical protein n=1 Tax=Novipirellula maiorica TaxID=1265734 RepID=UPI000344CD2E|nr:hypothetical protein [Rhodopirellula maiorica]
MPASSISDVSLDESAASTYSLNPSPHTAQVLQSIQPLYERLSQQSPTRPDIVAQMIRATIRLALIQRQLGQTSDAIESLEHGIDVLRRRGETAGLANDESQLLMMRLQNELGDVYAVELRFDESEQAFETALSAASDLGVTDSEAVLQLARAHVGLGDPPPQRRRIESQENKLPRERRLHLRTAVELLDTLHETGNSASLVTTLRARVRLAQSRIEKRPAAKRARFNDAIEILRQRLDVAPSDIAARYTLVEALAAVNLRREVQTKLQRSEAAARLREALAELQTLKQQFPDTPIFGVSEVHIRHKLSNLAKTEQEYDEANQQLQKAIAIQSTLVNATPENISHRCWRALLYRSLAEVCDLQGNQDAADEAVANAVADIETIAPADSDHPFVVQTRQIIEALSSP